MLSIKVHLYLVFMELTVWEWDGSTHINHMAIAMIRAVMCIRGRLLVTPDLRFEGTIGENGGGGRGIGEKIQKNVTCKDPTDGRTFLEHGQARSRKCTCYLVGRLGWGHTGPHGEPSTRAGVSQLKF